MMEGLSDGAGAWKDRLRGAHNMLMMSLLDQISIKAPFTPLFGRSFCKIAHQWQKSGQVEHI